MLDAEEGVVSRVAAPTLSITVTRVLGATGAVDDGEDGVTGILELNGLCEALAVDLGEGVIVDVAAPTFSLSQTHRKKAEQISPLPVEMVLRSCSPS